jgi:ZIP family zinc transporter
MGGAMWPAFLMSAFAGMSTTIGGFIAIFSKRTNERFLAASLGFSAGVMLLVSFNELLPDSKESLTPVLGERLAGLAAAASLLAGVAIALLIGKLVPSQENARKSKTHGTSEESPMTALVRVGFVTAVAVTVHNLPEGIATFMAGYADIRLGLPVAVSIALHNIPEGIAVAVPVYYGTGSRFKAVLYSALSGLSEPVGALLAFLVLAPFINAVTLGIIFGAVAGIMIYISFDGLIPSSQMYGHTVAAIVGIFSGIAFMKFAMTVFGL